MDIVVRANNLYRNGFIVTFDDGEELLLRDKLVIEGTVKDSYHTVLENDRLDKIAYNKYKNLVEDASKYWWVIADANDITNPLDISELVNTEILIPNILDIILKLE